MKKFYFIITLLLCSFIVKADESKYIKYVRNLNTAHLIEPGQMELTFKVGLMNDTIDIFNFKNNIAESENLDLSQFSNFGDWQSYHTLFNFGMFENFNVKFELGLDLIEIGKSQSEIQNFAIEFKYMLVEEKSSMPAVSISAGFNTHIANNITGNINALNFNVGELEINQTFNPPEELTVGGLNDRNFYIGLHIGKIFSERLMLYTFNRFTYTTVDSEFSTSLEIGQFQKLENDFKYKSNSYKMGFGCFYQLRESLLLTGEYSFNYFDRNFSDSTSFEGKNENTAHTVDISLHYFMTDHLAVSVGTWLNSSFLSGEIPLTYNRKSASKFDNPYGQLYVFFTLGFSSFK